MIEFGPLDALAHDPTVTDVAIDLRGRVWADRGGGMTECRLPMPLRTPRIVREYAVRLCAQLGRRLDDACPIADASSEDGIRVHAVIAPLVAQGAAVTIRFPDRRLLGLTGLRDAGMFPPDWLTLLRNRGEEPGSRCLITAAARQRQNHAAESAACGMRFIGPYRHR